MRFTCQLIPGQAGVRAAAPAACLHASYTPHTRLITCQCIPGQGGVRAAAPAACLQSAPEFAQRIV